jgi:peptide/nickel transport system ATP-binding protein
MIPLVQISGLTVDYRVGEQRVRALDGVDLVVEGQQALGIVGESGSGKSTLGLAFGRLLPANGAVTEGELLLDGRPVLQYTPKELRAFRRDQLGFVFQSPFAALDPTRRIHRQLRDVLDTPRSDEDSLLRLLARVGFTEPRSVAAAFPHQLSGGMAQRVVVALAIARRPKLVIADEPTASLDSSVRNLVLDVLFGLPKEIGAALVVLTHDLRSVASRCSQIAVMYGGRVVESGARQRVLGSPRHPYTLGLLTATPGEEGDEELVPIAGVPPVLRGPLKSCAYATRCPLASAVCFETRPEAREVDDRTVVCHHAEQLRPGGPGHSRSLQRDRVRA